MQTHNDTKFTIKSYSQISELLFTSELYAISELLSNSELFAISELLSNFSFRNSENETMY